MRLERMERIVQIGRKRLVGILSAIVLGKINVPLESVGVEIRKTNVAVGVSAAQRHYERCYSWGMACEFSYA